MIPKINAVRIPIAPATYMFSFISWTVPYTAVEIAIPNELPSELAILQRPVAIPLVIVDMDKRGIHRRFCVHTHTDAGDQESDEDDKDICRVPPREPNDQ